jgi:hypothetical protein
MRCLRVSIAVAVLVLAMAGAAGAKTPDGRTPSEETVCDVFTGAAFGLCNAYCEAMDCDDPNVRASAAACARVEANFQRVTGGAILPCVQDCDPQDELGRFRGLLSGTQGISACFTDGISTVLIAQDGSAVAVTLDPAGGSSLATSDGMFLEVDTDRAAICTSDLLGQAALQQVECVTTSGDE